MRGEGEGGRWRVSRVIFKRARKLLVNKSPSFTLRLLPERTDREEESPCAFFFLSVGNILSLNKKTKHRAIPLFGGNICVGVEGCDGQPKQGKGGETGKRIHFIFPSFRNNEYGAVLAADAVDFCPKGREQVPTWNSDGK